MSSSVLERCVFRVAGGVPAGQQAERVRVPAAGCDTRRSGPTGPCRRGCGLPRRAGWRRSGRQRRPCALQVIQAGALNVGGGQKAGASIAPSSRPTVVFCANDLIALGVLQEMTRNHIGVPEDISIVGYDDIDFAAAAAVPLTSVRQPRLQLGHTAARLLLDEADDDETHQHHQVIFEPELVVRQSTQPAPDPALAPEPSPPRPLVRALHPQTRDKTRVNRKLAGVRASGPWAPPSRRTGSGLNGTTSSLHGGLRDGHRTARAEETLSACCPNKNPKKWS